MSIDLSPLAKVRRMLLDVPLVPLQGTRFQPTGFPDLGAATYQAGDDDCLLVESAQSMANRLEATIWDEATNELIPPARGLSYVRVSDDKGGFLTASVLEAHRLNSPYIEKSQGEFWKALPDALGADKKRPVNRARFLRGVLRFDVNALLHGLFLESIDGRLRIARALSAFIEARGISVAASGGVKNDRVRAETKSDSEASGKKGGAAEGFGNVPFHREEYTAREITASISLDLEQIRGYGLPEAAERLLVTLALFKIRALLEGSLRLRTACDLSVKDGFPWAARPPVEFVVPSMASLAGALQSEVALCKNEFAPNGGVVTVAFKA